MEFDKDIELGYGWKSAACERARIHMLLYLYPVGSLILCLLGLGLTYFLSRRFHPKKGLQIFGFVLFGVACVAYMSYIAHGTVFATLQDIPGSSYAADPNYGELDQVYALSYFSLGGKGLAFISGLSIILFVIGNMLLVLDPFFKIKCSKLLIKWLVPLELVLFIAVFPANMVNILGYNVYLGASSFNLPSFLISLVIGLDAYEVVLTWKNDPSLKTSWKNVGVAALALIGFFLAYMPKWFFTYFFGLASNVAVIEDFSFAHRIVIYIAFGVPFILNLIFRSKDVETKRYVLLVWIIGAGVCFSHQLDYRMLYDPREWPLHACNLAMYIMLVCFAFKFKQMFYWTYFIMVFGGLMAILMPQLNDGPNVLSEIVVVFFVNHWCVFGAPILGVMWGVFPRPKMKNMWWSFFWFTIYFVTIVLVNAFFGTDFLYTNSTFIADKVGDWATSLFASSITTPWFIVGTTEPVVFHLPFIISFYLVYLALAFGCWFVFAVGYQIQDRHYAMIVVGEENRQARRYFVGRMQGKGVHTPMEPNAGISLEIKHFYKRYGQNPNWAVEDANLTVKGGSIFGFLGPNGAGKSTTIKSIVGIQALSQGQILVCGYDIAQQSVEAKREIGYVPDHYALYEKLTGRQYINYVADIYDVSLADRNERIKKYTELFHLVEAFDAPMATYSHGMKQKITIIAALVHNPPLWILDEPLTGLDPDSIFQVKECMRLHAQEGNMVIFSSHLIDVVENLCDHVVVIKKGHMSQPISMADIHKKGSLEDYYMNMTGDTFKYQIAEAAARDLKKKEAEMAVRKNNKSGKK